MCPIYHNFYNHCHKIHPDFVVVISYIVTIKIYKANNCLQLPLRLSLGQSITPYCINKEQKCFDIPHSNSNSCFAKGSILHSHPVPTAYATVCVWWCVSSMQAPTSPGAVSPWWWSTTIQASHHGRQSAGRGASVTSPSTQSYPTQVSCHQKCGIRTIVH